MYVWVPHLTASCSLSAAWLTSSNWVSSKMANPDADSNKQNVAWGCVRGAAGVGVGGVGLAGADGGLARPPAPTRMRARLRVTQARRVEGRGACTPTMAVAATATPQLQKESRGGLGTQVRQSWIKGASGQQGALS